MKGKEMEAATKQLLLNISEILEQKGLISSEEKQRMRNNIVSAEVPAK